MVGVPGLELQLSWALRPSPQSWCGLSSLSGRRFAAWVPPPSSAAAQPVTKDGQASPSPLCVCCTHGQLLPTAPGKGKAQGDRIYYTYVCLGRSLSLVLESPSSVTVGGWAGSRPRSSLPRGGIHPRFGLPSRVGSVGPRLPRGRDAEEEPLVVIFVEVPCMLAGPLAHGNSPP